LWPVAKQEASLPRQESAKERAKKAQKDDARIDEQSAESFPASDPPSYAGGSHAIGGPRRPKPRQDKS
jgi:hypothetical protein